VAARLVLAVGILGHDAGPIGLGGVIPDAARQEPRDDPNTVHFEDLGTMPSTQQASTRHYFASLTP
jgi:hypothetical protein